MFPQLPGANVGLLPFLSRRNTHTGTRKHNKQTKKTKQAETTRQEERDVPSSCVVSVKLSMKLGDTAACSCLWNFRHNSLEPMSQLVNSIPGFQLTNLVSSNKVCWNNSSCYKSTNSPSSKTLPKFSQQTGSHPNVSNQQMLVSRLNTCIDVRKLYKLLTTRFSFSRTGLNSTCESYVDMQTNILRNMLSHLQVSSSHRNDISLLQATKENRMFYSTSSM